jgi:fatty-acyl-CoA synthase
MLTHRGILASARAQVRHLGWGSDDVLIGHMPMNHVGGLTCTVAASLVAGAQVVILPEYSPRRALRAITDQQVSVFIGVPTMYTMMMSLPEFASADLSRVTTCVIGGSNVEPTLGRRIENAFPNARLANLYGLSETSGGCIISGANDDRHIRAATIGVPIGDFEVRIAGADGRPVATGVEGQLQIKGACVASGYWQQPEASRATFLSDGWLNTGDVAAVCDGGRVALRGRTKEMYVRGGYNVYPTEIENVLASHPAVVMSAVVGVADPTYGEVGIAFVVPRKDARANIDELESLCQSQLAKYKVPEEIRIVSTLPMTPTGKVRKDLLLIDPPSINA